jgi:putative tryptophan/tyrosine transport system substrate-binding protein
MGSVRRREFIALVGSVTVVAWRFEARAQQSMPPVIAFLRSTSLGDATHLVNAFRKGLADSDFVEGQNVAVEYHSAEDQLDRLQAIVADLISRQVAVIVGNTNAAVAAKAMTRTVPIVFATGGDPVSDGLVVSLSRPGGNVTGVTFLAGELGAKRLELLRELAPNATAIGVLANPESPEAAAERREVLVAAEAIKQRLVLVDVSNDQEIEQAFATFAQRGTRALFVGSGAFLNSQRERIVALASRQGLPAIYALREYVSAGGLMSYGTSITDAYRQAGTYAARILKGAKPAELPVLQPTKFEFVINLKPAKALGITIPQSILLRADEVIE